MALVIAQAGGGGEGEVGQGQLEAIGESIDARGDSDDRERGLLPREPRWGAWPFWVRVRISRALRQMAAWEDV